MRCKFKALFAHPIDSSSSATLVVAEFISTSISSSGKCSRCLKVGTEDLFFVARWWQVLKSATKLHIKSGQEPKDVFRPKIVSVQVAAKVKKTCQCFHASTS